MTDDGSRPERPWLRAAGLLAVTLLLSVVQPLVLVLVPLALLSAFSRERRGRALFVALVAGFLAVGGASRLGLWYLERGWAILVAGWFVALSLRWPASGFVTRGLGAVAGAFAGAAALLLASPDGWSVVDWVVSTRLTDGASSALIALGTLQGDAALSPALVSAVRETAVIQGRIFPALLGLSSVAGLGVAWWLYRLLVMGSSSGLGPLRDFRFSDQLVWILVLGCVLLLVGGPDGVERTGTNAIVFMGGLYALRGAAVMLFLNGGISLLGGVLVALALVLLPPVVIAGALIVGLGDTWLDIRGRLAASST